MRVLSGANVRQFGRFLGRRSYCSSANAATKLRSEYDAVVIGGGHNGLAAAAYLAMAGKSVCVLERRHVLGGACVTEEIVPGFKFSRASYSLLLLRPQVCEDLDLERHGLKVYHRDAATYTPLREPTASGMTALSLKPDMEKCQEEIRKFSTTDAETWPQFNKVMKTISSSLLPLLDVPPIDLAALVSGGLRGSIEQMASLKAFFRAGRSVGSEMGELYDLLTAPSEKFLGRWFESEVLRSTLAAGATIGVHQSPRVPGSGYNLMHWSLGSPAGKPGQRAFVEGGMGSISECIASAAREHGAAIFTEQEVRGVIVDGDGRARGVHLADGREVRADLVLSNATAEVTFRRLLAEHQALLPDAFRRRLATLDYSSSVMKINVAVSRLPTFAAHPEPGPQPFHQATILLNAESCEKVHRAFLDAEQGRCSQHPLIRMTIPSVMDPTLAPPGAHVVLFFVQYFPFALEAGAAWDEATRAAAAERVFDEVEAYCPGFKSSIIGADVLSPRDLQDTFGLTGGNIYHGAMTMDQVYFARPAVGVSNYRTPIPGLYMCGSSAHPGGGVTGSPGRLAVQCILNDLKKGRA